MKTSWKVTEVRAVEGCTTATLIRGYWFKPNPERKRLDAEYDAYLAENGEEATEAHYLGREWPEETIEVEAHQEVNGG